VAYPAKREGRPVRAVKGKNNVLGLINNFETRLYELIQDSGWIGVQDLQERELYMAEDLHVRNVLKKVQKGSQVGFSTYNQKQHV